MNSDKLLKAALCTAIGGLALYAADAALRVIADIQTLKLARKVDAISDLVLCDDDDNDEDEDDDACKYCPQFDECNGVCTDPADESDLDLTVDIYDISEDANEKVDEKN